MTNAQIDPSSSLSFSTALEALRDGKDMYLGIQVPYNGSKMQQPYIFIQPVNTSGLVPWVASQTDLLAFDWYVVE